MSSQITIKDIAKALSISPSTVSRALKDHPDISKSTKKAVTQLAKELNYEPNYIALSLRKSKTNTIGIIIPEIVHYFFSTIISGIEDVAYNSGYNVIISQSNESFDREVSDTKALLASRVDGFLVSMSKETTDVSHFQDIVNRGIPLVVYDRVSDDLNVSQVVIDDYFGAYKATEHLISIGCKRIAHFQGPLNQTIFRERLRGYKDALKNGGIPFDESLVKDCYEGTLEEAKAHTAALLKLKDRPDGIFSNNDLAAIAAMSVIKKGKLRIPEDIAVVGFSDWQVSSLVDPSLSSVTQPGFEMGQKAAMLFLEQIKDPENHKPRKEVLKPELIIRDSSRR
ncbi:MAG: LacI family DNA-binding transcriptional regulator [Cyclobacteriaceae bacterium]